MLSPDRWWLPTQGWNPGPEGKSRDEKLRPEAGSSKALRDSTSIILHPAILHVHPQIIVTRSSPYHLHRARSPRLIPHLTVTRRLKRAAKLPRHHSLICVHCSYHFAHSMLCQYTSILEMPPSAPSLSQFMTPLCLAHFRALICAVRHLVEYVPREYLSLQQRSLTNLRLPGRWSHILLPSTICLEPLLHR